MATKKANWRADKIEAFTRLARQGYNSREIGDLIGLTKDQVLNGTYDRIEMRRIWKESADARRERKERMGRGEDVGGPIAAELKAMATAASEARRQREAAPILLAECEKMADAHGCVSLAEVAEKLDWKVSDASRIARRLADAGEFPYRLKAREIVETVDEVDVPWLDLEAVRSAAGAIRREGVTYDDASERGGVLTPSLASIVRAKSAITPGDEAARYLREWKAMRKAANDPDARARQQAEAERRQRERECNREHHRRMRDQQQVA